MQRRTFLKLGIGSLFPSYLGTTEFYGWLPGHNSRLPRFRMVASHLCHRDKVEVKALLYKPFEKVTGHPFLPHRQEWGDCVAHSSGASLDVLTCIQVLLSSEERKQRNIKKQKWITQSSTDMIYSGGRRLIGHDYSGQGMRGIWAMKYLNTYGNLLRQRYDPYDLVPYSKETVTYWDQRNIPDSLLKEAKKHPLLTYAPVRSAAEIRDSIAAGYPVVFCSYLGLNDRRDKDGFVRPKGSWAHAMMISGVDTEFHRPGFLVQNSWGAWASGPKRNEQPSGSVWVDYNVIDRHVKSMGDSYALSLYRGFPAPDRDYILW